jgi:hypothetical protein
MIEADGALDVMADVVSKLGPESVAAGTVGSGRFLVEMGADTWEQLDEAHRLIEAHQGTRSVVTLRTDGSALRRAEQ